MKHYHNKRFEIPLYRGWLNIVLSDDTEKLEKIYGIDFNVVYAHSLMCNYNNRESYDIVLNFNHEGRGITPGIIAHEALHITIYIAQNRGLDFENDESLCYLIEWIVDRIYKTIIKYQKENDIIIYDK